MPSPFPGMNPYLEQDYVWHDFHERFLIAASEVILEQVDPDYLVRVDEHVYVHELPDAPRRLLGRADLGVTPERPLAPARPALGLIDAPAHVRFPEVDIEREAFLEIRDRRSRELVCVVELLSPSNKRPGTDRDQYLFKRGRILASPAHLVEIDLLRGGPPMPLEQRPDCTYCVMVSRYEDRPEAGFWPIGLREQLPAIPIPLRPPHAAASLDLQALLHRVYDAGRYRRYLYEAEPLPGLAQDDLAWARALIASPNP